jgi:uncharacterized protein YegP (UPF0339 family)
MTKHTETPWEVFESNGDTLIRAKNGKTVVDSEYNGSMTAFANKEDAAFICKAVNAHEDLVKAARRAVDVIKGNSPMKEIEPWAQDVCRGLLDALKKADAPE